MAKAIIETDHLYSSFIIYSYYPVRYAGEEANDFRILLIKIQVKRFIGRYVVIAKTQTRIRVFIEMET